VQLALPTDVAGRSLTRPVIANRTTCALLAGVALAGASLMAFAPAGGPTLPTVQHHEVQLVDVWENPIDPATVFTTALANIDNIQTAIGNVPLNDALTDLFTGYGDRLANSFEVSANAFQELAEQFPTTLQTSLNFLADGQFVEAYSEFNSFGLFGLEDLAAPLYDLVSSRRGEGILNDLAQQTYNVINALSTRGDVNGFAEALLGPSITANFETALIADNIEEALNAGDYNGAFNDLLNAPSQILGAYLNGADFPFGQEEFPGILSPEGPFQFLFVTLPTQIADAISAPAAAAAGAEAIDVGDWSALFGSDWSALFDASNLSALFDASDLSALFDVTSLTDTVASVVDPGVVSDGLTALATSIF
jgi:hypothetical protein